MAKRKHKQRSEKGTDGGHKADWDFDDEAALMAWLDYCVAYETDFKASVTGHLKETRGKNFTLRQVDTKIRFLWNNCGSENSKSIVDVYQQGTVSLTHLLGEEKEAIKKAKEALLEKYEGKISSEGEFLREPQLQNASRTIAPEHRRYSSQESGAKPSLRSSRMLVKKDPSRKKQKVGADLEDGVGSTQMDGGKLQNTVRLVQRSKPRRGKRSARIQARSTTISDSDDGSGFSENYQDFADVSAHTHPYSDIDQALPPIIDGSQMPSQSQGEPRKSSYQNFQHIGRIDDLSAESLNAALRRKMQWQDARIASLFNQLQSLAKHIKDHGDCLASAINQHKKALPTYSKDQQISMLQQKLTLSQNAGRFIAGSDYPFVGVTEKELKTRMGDMEKDIDEIIHLSGQLTPSIPPDSKDVAHIEWILRRSFGLNSQPDISLRSLMEKFSQMAPRSVVRALVAAAVSEWILESDFPNFDEGGSCILTKYREHLALQDGASVVRSLDTAAHYSLINENHFQTEIIPERAEELAIRLSQTLTPFYPHASMSPLPDGFYTWGQTEEDHQQRRYKVINLFENALKLKADLILKAQEYELVTPVPGTVFDAMSMRVDWELDIDVKSYPGGRPRIQLCLFPALFSYDNNSQAAGKEGTSAMDTDLPRMTVQYRNFSQRSQDERRGAKLISKAVVILEKLES
ncbi:hypothetical protein AOQ84DRAFT_420473 [Glonium stellatum]|uniref:Uncharacterized protein n=1 Tax=Glonium stellatum TaxID=574774 RepID=A0A8E2FDI6_9PEZI|nr:hypothetical protein AOQ84DRAFT_420473 [Glonium stellatum]